MERERKGGLKQKFEERETMQRPWGGFLIRRKCTQRESLSSAECT